MNGDSTISVITSIYKGQKYIDNYLASVKQQTVYQYLEIIIFLNEPSNNGINYCQKFEIEDPEKVRIVLVNPKELLSSS